jgi:hypothetical protein
MSESMDHMAVGFFGLGISGKRNYLEEKLLRAWKI